LEIEAKLGFLVRMGANKVTKVHSDIDPVAQRRKSVGTDESKEVWRGRW